MKYNLISADTHMDLVYMPPEMFVENAPSALRDKMPRVEDTEEGLTGCWKAKKLCPLAAVG